MYIALTISAGQQECEKLPTMWKIANRDRNCRKYRFFTAAKIVQITSSQDFSPWTWQSGRWLRWGSEWTHSFPQLWHFQWSLKKKSSSTQFIKRFWSRQPFKTCWSEGRVQLWVQVWAPAFHLVISPEGYFRQESKVLTAKISGQTLRAALRHRLGG